MKTFRCMVYTFFVFLAPSCCQAYQLFFTGSQYEVQLNDSDFSYSSGNWFRKKTNYSAYVKIVQNKGSVGLIPTDFTMNGNCGSAFTTGVVSKSINFNSGENTTYGAIFKNVLGAKGNVLFFEPASPWIGSAGQRCLSSYRDIYLCLTIAEAVGSGASSIAMNETCQVTHIPPANMDCYASLNGGGIDITTDEGVAWNQRTDISVTCNAEASAQIELRNNVGDKVRLTDIVKGTDTFGEVWVIGERLTQNHKAIARLNNGTTNLAVRIRNDNGTPDSGVYSGAIVLALTYI
ncbi:hypothetical protein GTGU_04288 [Trabulsiella guamensis ATCC 49490]|uniref:Uncharacterized protein n=1 Tax=Trabulsiella guamensis ATCC 49490 TaxID=1005994 RepID=A0A084ZP91_9ENTR|nr:hypothetical protein [Trabulsiella guamensis]KFB99285.1 hypothetical protein GTGU_04288 [Trabulsiella guamensis ATCC 49490]